jgi:hypothetical protein
LQTYSNGEVVRWITKDESADEPAPHLSVTAAQPEGGAAAAPTSSIDGEARGNDDDEE